MGPKGSHNDIELPFRDGLTLLVRLLVHCLLVYIRTYNVIFLGVKCSHIGGLFYLVTIDDAFFVHGNSRKIS